VTILTSLLGTKAFGLMVYLWQAAEATPAATPGVNHFSPMQMIKSMGPVAIAVVVVPCSSSAGIRAYISSVMPRRFILVGRPRQWGGSTWNQKRRKLEIRGRADGIIEKWFCLLRCICHLLAHRDMMHCRTIMVANGAKRTSRWMPLVLDRERMTLRWGNRPAACG